MDVKTERDPKIQAAIDLLRSWREAEGEEAEEQRETGELLMKALAESRGVWIGRPTDEG
jgi:hypothetical protein